MVSQSQKKQMSDYLVAHLEGFGENVEPDSKDLVSGINSHFILVGKNKVVLLVDQVYPNDSLNRVYRNWRAAGRDIALVLYKDGKTFFRDSAYGEKSGLEGKRYKATKDLSLKNYDDEAINRMITFRPEETFARNIVLKGLYHNPFVQYYQPESEGLREGLETFMFGRVTFDYTHLPHEQWPNGESTAVSKRLFIWQNRTHLDEDLAVHKGLMIPKRLVTG